MYPGQFYTKQFIDRWYRGKSNITSEKQRFYDSEKIQMKFINSLNAPSDELISRVQLEQIKNDFSSWADQKVADELNKIGNGLNQYQIMPNFTLEDGMNIVESVLSRTIGEYHVDNTDFLQVLSTPINKGIQEFGLSSYKMALNKLRDLKNFLMSRETYSRKDIEKYLSRLDNSISRLELDVAFAEKGKFGNSNYGYWWSTSKTGGLSIVESGRIGAIWGSGNKLKGSYFEAETFNIIRDHLVTTLGENYVTIDVSKVNGPTFDILGTVKGKGEIRTDLLIFNKNLITNNIKITYLFRGRKKTATILQFIEDCNASVGEGTISIENDEWEKIIGNQGFIAGGQQKAGWNQYPMNDFPVKVSTGFALAAGEWYSFFLAMKKWYGYNHIYANAPELDAVFNLGVAKQVTYVIGKQNSFFVLRNKIITTYDYFKNIINENCYIRGLKKISLAQNDQTLKVNLKKGKLTGYNNISYTKFIK